MWQSRVPAKHVVHVGGVLLLFEADLLRVQSSRLFRFSSTVGLEIPYHLLAVTQGGAGATAVRCSGTGILQGVRVIHLSRDTFFWFEVHSGRQGRTAYEAQGAASTAAAVGHPVTQLDEGFGDQLVGAAVAAQNLAVKSVIEADTQKADSLAHRAKAWSAARYANLVVQ